MPTNEFLRLVHYSLGVPSILSEESRRRAAAAALDRIAKPSYNEYQVGRSEGLATHTMSIIESVVQLGEAGDLDAYLGQYETSDDLAVDKVVAKAQSVVNPESARKSASALLQAMRNYLTAHPFVDGQGRPFR